MRNESNIRGRRRMLAWLAGLFVLPESPLRGTSRQSRAANHESPVTNHQLPVGPYAPVVPGYVMRFPHDEGSHPYFRIEWWYVTGWLEDTARRPSGFQITFFRARPEIKHENPSAFTPHQIMIAHAALSDPSLGRLIHDERAARAAFDLAGAAEGRTHVWVDDWSLEQRAAVYHARLPARDFRFDLTFTATQPPLLQGDNGLSRKGPAAETASYYYSLPHLIVGGTLTRDGQARTVGGRAWLDHEWSSSYMDKAAVGWDWIGINLDDGGALMAFRMRDAQGGAYWAGGTLRRADGTTRVFAPPEIRFMPRRAWRSARTGASYPIWWMVKAGDFELTIEPLMDDQEHDARRTTGMIYWEGAVRASASGTHAGRGYLELTGYWRPARF